MVGPLRREPLVQDRPTLFWGSLFAFRRIFVCKLVSDRVVSIELSFEFSSYFKGFQDISDFRLPREGNDLFLGLSEIFIHGLIDNQSVGRIFFCVSRSIRFI